jgi:hypothetical protein
MMQMGGGRNDGAVLLATICLAVGTASPGRPLRRVADASRQNFLSAVVPNASLDIFSHDAARLRRWDTCWAKDPIQGAMN